MPSRFLLTNFYNRGIIISAKLSLILVYILSHRGKVPLVKGVFLSFNILCVMILVIVWRQLRITLFRASLIGRIFYFGAVKMKKLMLAISSAILYSGFCIFLDTLLWHFMTLEERYGYIITRDKFYLIELIIGGVFFLIGLIGIIISLYKMKNE